VGKIAKKKQAEGVRFY